jgi:NADPH:quinone reductase-like Zn-dependent oxidoreductase
MSDDATMKAIRFHAYGGPDVLLYEDAPKPEAGPGEVLVRVFAAGVNPFDWKVREGLMKGQMHHRLPLIPGWDLSGTVESLGKGAARFSAGAGVFGKADPSRDGAYAEFVSVAESSLAEKPASLDHVTAAAIPTGGLTAWQALFEPTALGLVRGQTVLIHGASGGVGSFAVQLAHHRGIRVIGTGQAKNEAFVRSLGADEFVDYAARRFEDVATGVDGVLDLVGGETQKRSFGVIRPGGALVALTEPPSEELARKHHVRATIIFSTANAEQLAELARMADAKLLTPVVSEVLPLSEARKAHEESQGHHARGKIVLKVR